MMKQLNEHEKVSGYHWFCNELKIFLRDKKTIDELLQTCVSAIMVFAESFIIKKIIWGITCKYVLQTSIDSAVESQNSNVKEKLGVNGKMATHKGIERISDNFNKTYEK